jgi:beta-lactamase class A
MNSNYSAIFIILVLFVSGCTTPSTRQDNSPNSFFSTIQPQILSTLSPNLKPLDFSELEEGIRELIFQYSANNDKSIVGVVIEDLNSSKGIEINSQSEFDAASIGKLPILTLLNQKIAKGLINPQEVIVIDESNVERYGTGSIQYQDLPKEYTITQLAELMITVSDNTASSVLATKIGRNDLAKHVQELGMSQTDTKNNTTIPYDTSIILRYIYDLYHKQDPHGLEMVEFLSNTIFKSRLTKLIPSETKVAHKIGTQVGEVHDAGIVFHQEHPYIIVVYTKGFTQTSTAEELIAEISRQTLAYFDKI